MKLHSASPKIQPSRSTFELRESPPENKHSPHSKAIGYAFCPQHYRNEEKATATTQEQSPLYHRGSLDRVISSTLLLIGEKTEQTTQRPTIQ